MWKPFAPKYYMYIFKESYVLYNIIVNKILKLLNISSSIGGKIIQR